MARRAVGRVVQVKGAVVDVEFASEDLPEIHSAIEIPRDGKSLILEVEQQLEGNWVRCVAMDTTLTTSPFLFRLVMPLWGGYSTS